MTIELVVDARAQLGECALSLMRTQPVVFWTDVEGCAVSRWHEGDGQVRTWTLSERVGSFALCKQGDPCRRSAARAPRPEARLNDGRYDRHGWLLRAPRAGRHGDLTNSAARIATDMPLWGRRPRPTFCDICQDRSRPGCTERGANRWRAVCHEDSLARLAGTSICDVLVDRNAPLSDR